MPSAFGWDSGGTSLRKCTISLKVVKRSMQWKQSFMCFSAASLSRHVICPFTRLLKIFNEEHWSAPNCSGSFHQHTDGDGKGLGSSPGNERDQTLAGEPLDRFSSSSLT